ncbi:hypothetical protein LCGC14_2252680, partial [marine sediment metagenome]
FGYLVGLIDGEGCISDLKNQGLRIDLTNTSYEMLEWLVRNVGGKIHHQRDRKPGKWKEVWDWIVHGSDARVIIFAIEPFLISKREDAKKVLDSSPTLKEGLARHPH